MKTERHHNSSRPFSRILRVCLSIPFFLLIVSMAVCQTAQSQEETPPAKTETSCNPAPIVVPTLPAEIPGYTELDPATQLHVTGTAQEIDLESYRLEVTGKVTQSLMLKYDDLRCMAKIEARPTLICPGFFQDIATWAGVPLIDVLELAGVQEGARGIKLVSADGYSSPVPIAKALSEKNFLAYEWEGEPIPVLHGFPIRAIFPELQGNKWAKWLVKIEVY